MRNAGGVRCGAASWAAVVPVVGGWMMAVDSGASWAGALVAVGVRVMPVASFPRYEGHDSDG